MEHQNRSVLKFNKYIVKKINYRANEAFIMPDTKLQLEFDFDAFSYISDDNREMEVELSVDIFKEAESKNYPFEMLVCIKGFFCMEMAGDRIQDFKANAIAILFPYIRAIISTYTANANVMPVILPPMNINAYLRKKENKGEQQT